MQTLCSSKTSWAGANNKNIDFAVYCVNKKVDVATARIQSSHFLGHCDDRKSGLKVIETKSAKKEGITREQIHRRARDVLTYKGK